MGCGQSYREPLASTPEEELILMHEQDLGLHFFTSDHNESAIRREALLGLITTKQLERLGSALNLDLRPLNDSSTPIAMFFSKLQSEGAYDAEKLVILGILLGCSNDQAKQSLLSQQADPEAKDQIDEPDLNKLLSDIAYISASCLPILALQNGLDEQIMKYLDKLSFSIRDLVVMQTNHIMRGRPSIPISEFKSMLESKEHSFWLSSFEVRQKLNSASKTLPRSFSSDSFKAFEERYVVQKSVEF
mmetsp:Transcript_26006/g.46066  ORF Transcript_26006/g.46066 Transcript_26006/m.46066 type:complete len:246 (-) Transcript_26006:36-773(-)